MEALCNLCPRACRVDRKGGQTGYCGMTTQIKIARAALHMWEEPCISGTKGSGTVFFTGCPLCCVFCQNHRIALGKMGRSISRQELTEIFLDLQKQGAININLVTPTHYVPQIREALIEAKIQGLSIPVVYNTGSYETVETLRQLEGLIDIYLPDFKYFNHEIAARYSNAPDYPQTAKKAIEEMVRQAGKPAFEQGIMRKGVMVRHMVLPGCTRDSKKVIEYLLNTYGERIYISIMNQYTPMQGQENYPELQRKITKREYEKVVNYAISIGLEQGFIQEGDTAKESFIPEFSQEP